MGGVRNCVYSTTSQIGNILEKSQGTPVASSGICQELQDGVEIDELTCPDKATCDIDILNGPDNTYGFGIIKGSCGAVIEVENSLPISADEIETKANEFIGECLVRENEENRAQIVRNIDDGADNGGGSSGGRGTGGAFIGCEIFQQTIQSIFQPVNQGETYCEGDFSDLQQYSSSDVQLSPLEGCACDKIKNPKSQADCNLGKCNKARYCEFKKGGWFTKNKCECSDDKCGGNFPIVCGRTTLGNNVIGCCKSTESCCGGKMCCDQQTEATAPVCKVIPGSGQAFCEPRSCPPPGKPGDTVSCRGFIDIVTKPRAPFLKCCPTETTCGYHSDSTVGATIKNPYCVKPKCGSNEFECGTNNDLNVGGAGKFCCPGGTTCKKFSSFGLLSYKCSYRTCSSEEELCKGEDESEGWNICCPKGTCNPHPNGVPDCR